MYVCMYASISFCNLVCIDQDRAVSDHMGTQPFPPKNYVLTYLSGLLSEFSSPFAMFSEFIWDSHNKEYSGF